MNIKNIVTAAAAAGVMAAGLGLFTLVDDLEPIGTSPELTSVQQTLQR